MVLEVNAFALEMITLVLETITLVLETDDLRVCIQTLPAHTVSYTRLPKKTDVEMIAAHRYSPTKWAVAITVSY